MITNVVRLEDLRNYIDNYIKENGDKVIDGIEHWDGTNNIAFKIHLTSLENPHGEEVGVIEVKKKPLGYKR